MNCEVLLFWCRLFLMSPAITHQHLSLHGLVNAHCTNAGHMTTSPPPPQAQRYLLPEANLGDLPPWSAFFEFVTMYFSGFKLHSDGLLVITQHGQSHYQERAYLYITFLVSLYSRWIFYVCHSLSGGRLNVNGQPYAWNSTKSWRYMFNVCAFNAVQCMCTCGSSTHCVCVSVCLCICVFVCVSVTALAGATDPFKSKVSWFLPNLQVSADSAVVAWWYLPEAIVRDSHSVAAIWNGKSMLWPLICAEQWLYNACGCKVF